MADETSKTEDFGDLIAAANKHPSEKTLARLNAALDKRRGQVCEHIVLPTVLGSALDNMSPGEQGVQAIFRQGYEDYLSKLGYEQARGLERAMIQHIGLCWLRLQDVELRYARVFAGSVSLDVGNFWERRLSAVQRRYLRAVDTLARLRKVPLNVQLNVAEKQVNVAGTP